MEAIKQVIQERLDFIGVYLNWPDIDDDKKAEFTIAQRNWKQLERFIIGNYKQTEESKIPTLIKDTILTFVEFNEEQFRRTFCYIISDKRNEESKKNNQLMREALYDVIKIFGTSIYETARTLFDKEIAEKGKFPWN